ncbi:MAG: hypothetical protein M3171_09110 [Actinomycetota bacterium]|nr:hypothetical protein [Actinomycetota bacterium]
MLNPRREPGTFRSSEVAGVEAVLVDGVRVLVDGVTVAGDEMTVSGFGYGVFALR